MATNDLLFLRRTANGGYAEQTVSPVAGKVLGFAPSGALVLVDQAAFSGDAAAITSGTLDVARLPLNVALFADASSGAMQGNLTVPNDLHVNGDGGVTAGLLQVGEIRVAGQTIVDSGRHGVFDSLQADNQLTVSSATIDGLNASGGYIDSLEVRSLTCDDVAVMQSLVNFNNGFNVNDDSYFHSNCEFADILVGGSVNMLGACEFHGPISVYSSFQAGDINGSAVYAGSASFENDVTTGSLSVFGSGSFYGATDFTGNSAYNSSLFEVYNSNYPSGFFKIDGGNRRIQLGDYSGDNNATYIQIDDSANQISVQGFLTNTGSISTAGYLLAGGGIGAYGKQPPNSRPATPTTLQGVIALLQSFGFCA